MHNEKNPDLFYGYLNPKIRAIDQLTILVVIAVHVVVLVKEISEDRVLST